MSATRASMGWAHERAGRITIYTDGACSGNPGPGGWGAILPSAAARRKSPAARPLRPTIAWSSRAAIEGLNALKRPCTVDLYTDSQYVRQGIMSWLANWKRRGWRTADKKPVKNEDLWRQLDEAAARHEIAWHWVKGHADDPSTSGSTPWLSRPCSRYKTAGRGASPPPW